MIFDSLCARWNTRSSSSNGTATFRYGDKTFLSGAAVVAVVVTVVPLMTLLLLPRSTKAFLAEGIRRPFLSSSSSGTNQSRRLFGTYSGGRGTIPDGMPTLPDGVVQYSQVPRGKVFTATTIPSGLLKEHTTKAGTWGVIRVQKGRLEYQINQPKHQTFELSPGILGIIEPTMKHQVKALSDDLEFVVEFHRYPNTGPVDEKREGL